MLNERLKTGITFLLVLVMLSLVSATSTMGCINCPQNGIISYTDRCDISGKNFYKGVYEWNIIHNGTIIASGQKLVDATKKFCIKSPISECGEYEINFGYAKNKFTIECEPEPPIVPEFGLITGMVVLLGALGTFFVIRRKNAN